MKLIINGKFQITILNAERKLRPSEIEELLKEISTEVSGFNIGSRWLRYHRLPPNTTILEITLSKSDVKQRLLKRE